jgi:Na+-translocating ferredoxin:NAD+ oxidoreductase RnfE subunit
MADNTDSGTNVTGVLLILFIVLKLTNNIDWSWLWVLSPLWIPVGIVVAIAALSALILLVMEAFKRW